VTGLLRRWRRARARRQDRRRSGLPVVETKHRYDVDERGVTSNLIVKYDGVVRHDDEYGTHSDGGTLTLSARVCECLSVPGRPGRLHAVQPPPDTDATSVERWWDSLCRTISFNPDVRFNWWVEQQGKHFTVRLRGLFAVRESDDPTGWRVQDFTWSASGVLPWLPEDDWVYQQIHDWLVHIARHEVDEFFRVNGNRFCNPHPEGPTVLTLHPDTLKETA
jgi:hypothetical protein